MEAFPKHLRVLAERADASLKPVVLENLAEEENPAGPHPQLWRDFAEVLGVSEEDIMNSPSLPGTQNVVHTFRDICANRSLPEAVAALYAYESQVPEIASTWAWNVSNAVLSVRSASLRCSVTALSSST